MEIGPLHGEKKRVMFNYRFCNFNFINVTILSYENRHRFRYRHNTLLLEFINLVNDS